MNKNENKDIRATDTPADTTATRELTDAELEQAAGGGSGAKECRCGFIAYDYYSSCPDCGRPM